MFDIIARFVRITIGHAWFWQIHREWIQTY